MKRFVAVLLLSVGTSGFLASPAFAQNKDAGTGTIMSVPVPSIYSHDNAETLYRQAKYALAEEMCKKQIAALEKSKGDKNPAIAEPLIDLATVYMRLAKFPEAKAAIERADSLLDKTKPDQALIYGRLGINKGWRLYLIGEAAAAAKICSDCRDLLATNNAKDTKDYAELTNNLGLMDEELADKEDKPELIKKARTLLLEGYQLRKKLTGDESPETAESLNNMGMHLLFNPQNPQDSDLAMSTLASSLEMAKKVYGENHPETAVAHATMAMALMLAGDTEEAEKELKIAMPVTEKTLGRNHPDMAYELTSLARIRIDQQRFSDAEKTFAEVVSINESIYGKTSPQVVPSLEMMEKYYESRGDTGKARELEKRIEGIKGKDI